MLATSRVLPNIKESKFAEFLGSLKFRLGLLIVVIKQDKQFHPSGQL